MSIWNDPHYRSEPLIVVSEYLRRNLYNHPNVHALCDFNVDDYGIFPCSAPVGNFKASILDGNARADNLAYKFGRKFDVSFSKRFELLPEPTYGLDAVYKLYNRIFDGTLQFKMEFDSEEIKNFCSKFLRAYGPSSYSSPSTWEQFSDRVVKDWDDKDKQTALYWYQQSEAVRHLTVAGALKSNRRFHRNAKNKKEPIPFLDCQAIFGCKERDSDWKAYRFASITILEYNPKRGKLIKPKPKSYVLLNKDITRLAQLLESTGKVVHYFTNYADTMNSLSSRLLSSAFEILTWLTESFENNTKHELNSICRSMDIAYNTYLASIAGDLSQRSYEEQIAKGHNGIYDKVFPLDKMVSLLATYKPREALELASIRKILPVPDFCIYSAQNKSYKMHMNPFTQIPHPDPEANWEDFVLYWEHSMIRNYFMRHKVCPGRIKEEVTHKEWHNHYPYIEPKRVPYKDIRDIDWEATFIWTDYQFAEHELKKDKTTAPKNVPIDLTSDELRDYPITERNQIASFICNPEAPTLPDLRNKVLNNMEDWDYIHLNAIKPEAKKEDGRMFSMANDHQRALMSEKEANIDAYLIHKPGNSSGISDMDLARQMLDIASLEPGAGIKVRISFDLEKWSPRMNRKLKQESYRMWSYAFGLPHIQKLMKVVDGSRMAFIKHDVHHEYRNTGADLEGYDAKTNTAMHIEVMGYAVNVARRQGRLKKGVKLLALIDDGGASLQFDYGTSNEEILDCIKVIEQTYNMVGLRLSWDKTFVSTKLFQYLNEVYYNGFKVTPGLKAFLRVGKDVDMPAKTIADDLDAIAGQIQGGIKAGSSFAMSFAAYSFEVFRTLKRWGRYKVVISDAHVLMCLLPIAHGGIGVRSMLQLATNESFNPVVAAIGNLKAFVHYYPQNRETINQILNMPVRTMTAENFLRAPASIRAEATTLNLQRFANVMRSWIFSNAKNPFILSVLAATEKQSSIALAERIKSMPAVTSFALKELANLRPEAAVDTLIGKLQRSQTAASLLGFKTTLRILTANRYQASQLIAAYEGSKRIQQMQFRK